MFPGYNTHIILKIDWSELDLFGHVNNVAFFKYIQAARVNYCESIGLTSINEKNKLSFIVVSTNCTFKIPLQYPGSVKIYSKTEWIKNSSFQLAHLIVDDKENVVAESLDTVVVFDYDKKSKVNMSNELKKTIETLENRVLS
ncbi:MAG: acyl-CoA thioesterase [Bacteroidetes bacterium]|nr:acyl-CoA thioesterase [Bacteroidota bacterium]